MEKKRGSRANERKSCEEQWAEGDPSTALSSSLRLFLRLRCAPLRMTLKRHFGEIVGGDDFRLRS